MQRGDASTSSGFFLSFKMKSPVFIMSYPQVEQDPKVDVSYFSSLCLSGKGKWTKRHLRELELKSDGFLPTAS